MKKTLSKILLFFAAVQANALEKSDPSILLFIGDSLTEGYGVSHEEAFPFLLQKKFKEEGFQIKLINAGIGGSTTAGAEQRLKWQLKNKPKWLFLCLGANDGLRGLSIGQSEANLQKVIELAKKNGVKVLLGGMQLPFNYGDSYRGDFQKMYKKLSEKYNLDLYPFLLEGVAAVPKMNQDDGIHPNDLGHKMIAEKLYPFLIKTL